MRATRPPDRRIRRTSAPWAAQCWARCWAPGWVPAIGGGRGAAIGAGSGAVLGTGVGANGSAYAAGGIQAQYDNAYVSCMVSKGNRLPAPPPVYVQPPAYLVQPAPYLAPGYPPPPPGYDY